MAQKKFLFLTWLAFTPLFAGVTPQVQGHRGCRGLLPENTLPAFTAAIEAGADVLEMDLAVTKDGVLVISHDPHINADICVHDDGRPIEQPILIHDLYLDEVKKFDCGSKKNIRFLQQTPIPGTRIPTLDEVFALVRNSKHPNAVKIGFNIETKIFKKNPDYTVGPEEFSQKVVEAFLESGFLDRITLQSFDFRTLKIAKKLEPSLKTVALIEDASIDMLAKGKKLGVAAISPDFKLLTKELVGVLHAEQLSVIPWTLNNTADWQSALDMQVDGIITDYPQALINFLLEINL